MTDYNQDKLTQDVLDAFAGTPDPRLRQLMTALVKHVHAFAREVDLTPDEWAAGLNEACPTNRRVSISASRRRPPERLTRRRSAAPHPPGLSFVGATWSLGKTIDL